MSKKPPPSADDVRAAAAGEPLPPHVREHFMRVYELTPHGERGEQFWRHQVAAFDLARKVAWAGRVLLRIAQIATAIVLTGYALQRAFVGLDDAVKHLLEKMWGKS